MTDTEATFLDAYLPEPSPDVESDGDGDEQSDFGSFYSGRNGGDR